MPRLALIDLADDSVIREVPTGGWVALPNGSMVAPAVAGWQGGGEVTYAKTGDGEQAVEGPPRYGIVEIGVAVIPDGARTAGPATLAFDAKTGRVIETPAVADDPQAPPPTAEDKASDMLAAFGLTLAELRAVLTGPSPEEGAGVSDETSAATAGAGSAGGV